jgi:hypothetical protein
MMAEPILDETVAQPPPKQEDADAFFVGESDLPMTLRVDSPMLATPQTDFEDETMESPPPPAALPETVIALPPPAEPPPTVAMPPDPTPPPARIPSSPETVPVAARPAPPPPAASARPAPAARRAPPAAALAGSPRRPASAAAQARRSGGGGGSKGAIFGVIGLVAVLAAAGAFFVLRGRFQFPGGGAPTVAVETPSEATAAPVVVTEAPPATEPPAAATAESTAAPEVATPIEVVTVVKATPSPRAAASPARATPSRAAAATAPPTAPPATAPPAAALAAAHRSQGDASYAAGQYEAAVAQYDEALRLAPQDDQAIAGRARAVAARDMAKRRFVHGVTRVTSAKAAKGGISGFEGGDITVAKALDYSGRVDFEGQPERARPGTGYSIRVSVTNDGKKPWKIAGATATVVLNGTPSSVPVNAPAQEIDPQQKITIGEVSGTWPEAMSAWRLEVVVSSKGGDTFKNQLTWR